MKKLKELPENYYLAYPESNDNKKFFYVGTSDLISKHRTDVFNTNYGIDTLTTDSENVRIFKIGITKDLKTRLSYYHKEITDFRILKSWNVKNPKTLEQAIVSNFAKSDYESFGREWFWDTNSHFEKILTEEIEWLIENSYTEVKSGYEYLFKK